MFALLSFGESPLVKLWPPVHSFTLITTSFNCFLLLLACLSVSTFIVFNHIFHTIRLTLCIQQDGKLDNLPGSLGTKKFCVLCVGRSNLAEDLYSYWFDNLGFTTEGSLLLRYITPSTWGSQRVSSAPSSEFLAPLPGSIGFSKGGYTLPFYFLCYCFLLSYFLSSFVLLVYLLKKPKTQKN